VWDLALACQGQVRTAGMGGVLGFDLPAVLAAADARGLDRAAVMALLPHIEAAMVAKVNERNGDT
jgi:hypothetical protein